MFSVSAFGIISIAASRHVELSSVSFRAQREIFRPLASLRGDMVGASLRGDMVGASLGGDMGLGVALRGDMGVSPCFGMTCRRGLSSGTKGSMSKSALTLRQAQGGAPGPSPVLGEGSSLCGLSLSKPACNGVSIRADALLDPRLPHPCNREY